MGHPGMKYFVQTGVELAGKVICVAKARLEWHGRSKYGTYPLRCRTFRRAQCQDMQPEENPLTASKCLQMW